MQTPQRATVEATAGRRLVMRGVNGDGAGTTAEGRPMTGALRSRRASASSPSGGHAAPPAATPGRRDADAVTLLIAAATSYRSYKDVGGDPAARVAAALDPAARKSVDALRAAHVRDHQRLFDRVTLDLGAVEARRRPTSASRRSPTATIPSWPRSTSSSAATC